MDRILHEQDGGFFVECGAYDGETHSNTLFFETERGWTGLLIEANPRAFRELAMKDRQVWSSPACVSTENSVQRVSFLANGYQGLIPFLFVLTCERWNRKTTRR